MSFWSIARLRGILCPRKSCDIDKTSCGHISWSFCPRMWPAYQTHLI